MVSLSYEIENKGNFIYVNERKDDYLYSWLFN